MFSICKRSITTRVISSSLANANKVKGIKDIPGPKSFLIVGSVPNYLPIPGIQKYDGEKVLASSILKYYEFGQIFKENFFGHEVVFLVDPHDYQTLLHNPKGTTNANPWPRRRTHLILEHVRKNELKESHHNGGIFVENDETWAKIRQTFQKSMSLQEVEKFMKPLDHLASEIVSKINKDPIMDGLINLDFLNVIFSYTTDYMGFLLFGETWNSLSNCLDPSTLEGKLIWGTTALNHATGLTDHGPPLWKYIKTPEYKLIAKCAKILDDAVMDSLSKRMHEGARVLKPLNTPSLVDTWIHEGNQDYRQILTFCCDMLLAGIDTSAYSMSFMFYHLSVNKEAQNNLYEQLYCLMPSLNSPITSEMLKEATYLKKCVKESLRLNPLSVGIGRLLSEDTVFSGYLVPQGTDVVTLNQATSRLPEYVEHPESFIPERWDPTDQRFKRLHPYITLPFSHGPRSCVGRRLAEQSIYVLLFKIFRNFEVEWMGEKALDVKYCLISKPDAPLLFNFKPRKN